MFNINRDEFEDEYPFKSNFLDINGNRMHYIDEGEGEPILMIHGNPTWSFYYRNIIKEFSKTNRCIAPDHIGCGLSSRPEGYEYTLQNRVDDLCSFVQKMDLQNINLVVHDWGGAIGFGMAVKYPDLIKSVTILNTAVFTSTYIHPAINICRTKPFGKLLTRGLNLFAISATKMAVCKKMEKHIKKGYLYPYQRYSDRLAIERFVFDIPMNPRHVSYGTLAKIEKDLKKVSCEKLILWADKDFCFNEYFLKRWKIIYKDARVKVFEDAGHYILEDALHGVIKEMREFI